MFEKEFEIGKKAVLEAMRITARIQKDLSVKDSLVKPDKSPVTIADFTSQAIICRMLHDHFPGVPIVAEEDSSALQEPGNKRVLARVLEYLAGDEEIGKSLSLDNLFESIDLGGAEPNDQLFWTLDPIDGTKGFLRGEQFAIALALIEKGEVILGILGCPNLKLEDQRADSGLLIAAVKGQGATIWNVATGKTEKIGISNTVDPREMRFVESYESSHSDQGTQLQVARILEMGREPVQMDSQVKYGVVSIGEAEIYVRIPNPGTRDYKEKIWDHAAGSLIVEEAGGIASDIFGRKLDFSAGKNLERNTGILVCVPCIQPRLVQIIGQLLA